MDNATLSDMNDPRLKIVDLRLQKLMEALRLTAAYCEDLPTLSKLKMLDIYGAMIREQLDL